MSTFVLTASHNIDRPLAGLHINRGEQITIHINMMGITPINLFNNTRCENALIQQFKYNGIDVPKTDYGVFGRGAWDIKMI